MNTGIQRAWGTCLLLVGLALPATGQEGPNPKREALDLGNEGMALYKQKDYAGALARLERAHELTPANHELLRLMGQCHAMRGDREQAYRYYQDYVQRCPKCMYAPAVRYFVKSYEDSLEGTPSPPPEPTSPPPEPRKPLPSPLFEVHEEVLEPPDPATQRAELLAKRLLSNARTIRTANPLGAVADCLEALKLVPHAHPLHAEARELFAELTWMPAPPFAAPPSKRADQLRKRAQILGPLEQAEKLKATKPKLAAIMAETAYTWADADDPSLERARLLLLELVSPEEMKRIEKMRELNHSQPRRRPPPAP